MSALHTGKWKVTTAHANHGIYVNYSGGTEQMMVTVCTTAGSVDILVNNSTVATVSVGECVTRSESLTNTSGVTLHLSSGTTASGTYGVSVLP
jgi:hypothetical protein